MKKGLAITKSTYPPWPSWEGFGRETFPSGVQRRGRRLWAQRAGAADLARRVAALVLRAEAVRGASAPPKLETVGNPKGPACSLDVLIYFKKKEKNAPLGNHGMVHWYLEKSRSRVS